MRNKKPHINLSESPVDGASDDSFRVFVKNSSDQDPTELYVFDTVGDSFFGDGVTALDVKKLLASNRSKQIDVYINSLGGLAYDGLSIYNELTRHDGRVEVTITGVAFSAASIIAMAGDVIRMHEASDIGIHRASTFAYGNKSTMIDASQWLENLDQHLIDIYSARTGASRSQVEQWLDGVDDGTLWRAKDAVEIGFADELIPSKQKSKEKNNQRASAAKARVLASLRSREFRTRRV